MKNVIQKSLIIAALAAIAHVHADDAHNKTFLNPRSHGVNLALENVNGWQNLMHREGTNKGYNGCLQVIGYYQASTDKDEAGEYFAPATNPPTNQLKENNFNFGSNSGNAPVTAQTLNYRHFVHYSAGIASGTPTELVQLSLNPQQRAYGITLNHHQNLDKALNGLYFSLNVPIVNVENNINANFTEVYNAATINIGTAAVVATSVTNALKNYFDGTGANNDATNAQAALQFLKFGKTNNDDSSSGIADIEFMLGYYCLYHENYRLAVNVGVTIPTGDDVKSEKLFQAIVGNGTHWGFGAGLDGGAIMWQHNQHNFSFHGALNYRYLFQSTEQRTLGLKNTDGSIIPWGHYALVGQVTGAATILIPAANKLTVDCDVTPGSQLDMILAFAYHNRGFTIDLGYNLYYRDQEDVDRKKNTPIFGTTANKWGIVTPSATASGSGISVGELQVPLVDSNITTQTAETPSQLSNKIYAGVSYQSQTFQVPLLVGFHTHYEWASDNAALSNWEIGGKAGLAF
ncbi:hypothetical protein IPF37_00250 [bacterium]|nr:MAG: hypothetical protein IPF37_00250 [bacterium]